MHRLSTLTLSSATWFAESTIRQVMQRRKVVKESKGLQMADLDWRKAKNHTYSHTVSASRCKKASTEILQCKFRARSSRTSSLMLNWWKASHLSSAQDSRRLTMYASRTRACRWALAQAARLTLAQTARRSNSIYAVVFKSLSYTNKCRWCW